ncbi:site-specific integrase [Pseudomonas sp.]|uniref:tyrosine-type recombinase/integrase n=1 Tax=Pseudomonas sp. TaxID=306 RepID=UPI0028A68251|nr:site-specific integrase [Pseudomonas sp.]
MSTSLRRFIAADGERTAVLLDSSGMPMYYPTLYTSWHLRSRSLAANSIVNALAAIKSIYTWSNEQALDIESLFFQCNTLEEKQIRDLCDFLKLATPNVRRVRKVVSIVKHPQVVSVSTHYFRLTIAADYLGFLARQISSDEKGLNNIKRMVAAIKATRPSKPGRSLLDREEKSLNENVVNIIEQALIPGSEQNPAKDYSVQVRNAVLFTILRLTGIRRGELLNLKIDDFNFSMNTMKIVRRPDSKNDTRVNQPTAKTRQRTIPLDSIVMARIHEYILHHRSKVPSAKKHGYLFVTHKEGPTQGKPLSISGFQKWMQNIASIVENSGLQAHTLRHHWNYNFSLHSDKLKMSSATEEKIRSYLMGWEETSGTASTYNRRHIKQKAAESVLALQSRHFKKLMTE